MATRRKLCRAIECPRKVLDTQLFCAVHFPQLTGRILAPVAANREAASGASASEVARIASGTNQAVTYLARKEGRGAQAERAIRIGNAQPGQGGEVTADPSFFGSVYGRGTQKYVDPYTGGESYA